MLFAQSEPFANLVRTRERLKADTEGMRPIGVKSAALLPQVSSGHSRNTMEIRFLEPDLKIPDRVGGEPVTSLAQRRKMLELGLRDYILVGSLGKWQANAVLDQLRAMSLAEHEAETAGRRREDRARAWEIALTLFGFLAILSTIWSLAGA